MVLLIPELGLGNGTISRIYIPLWFYLYGIRLITKWCFPSGFTFHYGSTYTTIQRFLKRLRSIYIPLWFYLYDWRKGIYRFCGLIYIPLWFYLYERVCRTSEGRKDLHSTMVLLIRWDADNAVLGIGFTFHYGSTYTDYADRLNGNGF